MRGNCSRALACPDDELESVRVSGHNPGLERLALSRAGGGQRLAGVRHKYPRERSRRSVTLVDRTNHHLSSRRSTTCTMSSLHGRVRHPSRRVG